MTRIARLLLVTAVALSLPRLLPGQEKATESNKSPAFLKHFTDEYGTLLAIPDPLPHLDRLLNSKKLREVLLSGPMAKLAEASATPLDPGILWTWLEENKGFVPDEIVMAVGNSSMDDLDHLIRMSLILGLCNGAVQVGEEAIEKQLPDLQKAFLEDLRKLRIPKIRIWVRLRDAEQAEYFLQGVILQVGMAAQGVGMNVRSDAQSITMKFALSDLLDAEVLSLVCIEMGLGTELNETLEEVGKLLGELTIETGLVRSGSGLLFTLGSREQSDAGPLTVKDLGPLYRADASTMLFARWDLGTLKKAARGWMELWDKWRETPVGRATIQLDEEDLLGSMRFFAEQLDRAGDSGALRVWADSSLHALMQERGIPPAPHLPDTGITRLVPATAEGVYLNSFWSLSDQLKASLTQFEDRLSTNWLKAELKGDEDGVAMVDAITAGYYEELADFRKAIFEESRKHFLPPSAIILGTKGRVEKFEMRGMDGTEPMGVSVKDLAVPEIAVVSRVHKPDTASGFLEETYKKFMRGLLAAAGKEFTPSEAPTPELDLGLGVPTNGFSAEWIKALLGDFQVTLDVRGDVLPHFFYLDDLMVLSTSVSLSKKLIATYRGKQADRLPVPRLDGDKTVAYGHMTGALFAKVMEQGLEWVRQVGEIDLPEEGIEIAKGIGELFRLLGRMQWMATDLGGVRTSRFELIPGE